jgi:hypothetical protein
LAAFHGKEFVIMSEQSEDYSFNAWKFSGNYTFHFDNR